jgi:hypothetical protein
MPGSREELGCMVDDRHPATIQVFRHFAYDHLPPHLQSISRACAQLAIEMINLYPGDGPELTAGLRKLLEAKDCFVRHALE